MTMVLGIDTGGTFTDGVLLERETKKIVASAKAYTTHENLIMGIRGVLEKLTGGDFPSVDYVALSTTLATNAIVENDGCRVGLFLIGCEKASDLPPCVCYEIGGSISITGKEVDPLDESAVNAAALEMAGKVDAVAVSGIFSVRNPDHENRVKEIVSQHLEVPVVMAHELTGTLGVKERTNTAVLNGKLISVITELMQAVKAAMAERNIDAPLMIVKGDGSLMNDSVAVERPIETILSGPAASIIGSTYLNDVTDGLVLDMGGTTTDVAVLKNGMPLLTDEGADVGGWRTRVSAVNAFTFGLGGDSYFFREIETGEWKVGPRRARPVSVVSARYPGYKMELFRRHRRARGLVSFGQPDGLMLLHEPPDGMVLTEVQEDVIKALREGPHTVIELARMTGHDANFFYADRLIRAGVLGLIGFTPTDILCAQGIYDAGDREAAMEAAYLIAADRGMKVEELFEDFVARTDEKLCRSLLTCVLERHGLHEEERGPFMDFVFENAVHGKDKDYLDIAFKLSIPVIGIGAPVHAWLPSAAKKFGIEPLISLYHEVANAVGAAAGRVMTVFSIVVQNHNGGSIMIFAPWGSRELFPPKPEDDGEAIPFEVFVENVIVGAIADGTRHLKENMELQGIEDYEILADRKDAKVMDVYNDNMKLFIESKLELIAVGLPIWKSKSRN